MEPMRKTVSSLTGVFVAISARPCAEKNSREPSRTTHNARPTAGHRLRMSPTLAFVSDWATWVMAPPFHRTDTRCPPGEGNIRGADGAPVRPVGEGATDPCR